MCERMDTSSALQLIERLKLVLCAIDDFGKEGNVVGGVESGNSCP